ncbi:hypothetical protein Goari_020238 [Gossypium aridum]|uniref:Uncharacterized protein n=1 Tax=Gossypium aridum TaxID=34290 RepID=A0A7J8WV43_GOSAI|nr:hypothetical protein [Gossypium aridum]
MAMGLHLITAAAKFYLLSSTPSFSPLLGGLICPFALKYCFNLSVGVARLYIDLIHAGRLFFFQLNRVVLEADHQPAAAPAGNGSRWQRTLRLVCRRIITHARRSPPALEFDVASFHTLAILSLVYRARRTQLRYDIEIKQGKDESGLGRFTIRWKVVVCGDRGIEVVSSRELDVERESL